MTLSQSSFISLVATDRTLANAEPISLQQNAKNQIPDTQPFSASHNRNIC